MGHAMRTRRVRRPVHQMGREWVWARLDARLVMIPVLARRLRKALRGPAAGIVCPGLAVRCAHEPSRVHALRQANSSLPRALYRVRILHLYGHGKEGG